MGIVACKDGAKRLKPLLEGDDDNQKNIYGISYQSDKESDNIFPEGMVFSVFEMTLFFPFIFLVFEISFLIPLFCGCVINF